MKVAQGTADGYHPFPRLQLTGIAQLCCRKIVSLNVKHGQIAEDIGAHQLGVLLVAAGHDHAQRLVALHHVVIGDHVPLRVNDYP